jgi:hypothetical protein
MLIVCSTCAIRGERICLHISTENCKHPTEEILHEYDEDSILGDSYWCGVCNELLQVG